MPRGRKKKEAFEDLDPEFKAAIDSASDAEIRNKVSVVAFEQQALMAAKEDDQDLKEKAEAAKEAGAIYKEGTKSNLLKIKYARSVLSARGKL